MLVDSHCHLNFLDLSAFEGELSKVIAHAQERGVQQLLSVATALDQHEVLLALTEQYPGVFMSVGVHPNESMDSVPSVEALLTLAIPEKVVAFGETGLDYYRDNSDKASQQASFVAHIEAAKRLKKPLIIHTRAAKVDTLALLRTHQAYEAGGVMHCFTEDYETAKKALDLNFYISFSGIVTFKNAVDLQAVAKKIPLERLLVETDSPYLAPHPYRGKPNVPGYVREVAQFLAELREERFETLCTETTKNFHRLFLKAAS